MQAAWWVEYVCRHGGADWLKSIGEDVPFYQYHHLDIILVLTIAAIASLTGTFFFWRTVFRYKRYLKFYKRFLDIDVQHIVNHAQVPLWKEDKDRLIHHECLHVVEFFQNL